MMVGPYLVSQLIGGVLGAGMAKVRSKLTAQYSERIHAFLYT